MTVALKILLGLGITVAGTILLSLLFGVCLVVVNVITEYLNKLVHYVLDWQARNTENKRAKTQASIHRLLPNEDGYNGLIWDGQTFLNLDTGELIAQQVQTVVQPLVEQMRIQNYETRKLYTAMSGLSLSGGSLPELTPQIESVLPNHVNLLDLLDGQSLTLENLIVGLSIDESGEQFLIRKSIHDLMHLLAIGITGAGKSSWVLSFLAEIAMVREPIDVLCIDVHGSAFNVLSAWDKLKYPVARTNDEARALLQIVSGEADRRKELYETVPLADNLVSYNQHTQIEPLYPWLVVIDEGTIMLADKEIGDYVARAVQGTRQYGLYCFMTGQTAKANVIDTPIRDNFPTRIAFNNEETSIKVALGGKPPTELAEIAGRGWARLKGRKSPVMMQAPFIRRSDFYRLISRSGPRNEMPVIEGEYTDLDTRVMNACTELGERANPTAVCTELYGYSGGTKFYDVRESMRRQGLVDE